MGRGGAIGMATALAFAGAWAAAAGCGGRTASRGVADAGTDDDACVDLPSAACVAPLVPPSGAPTTAITAAHNYAIRSLFLGTTDRQGVHSSTAWQSYGYDLDGLVTTAQSTDVCTLAPGAPLAAQQDGLHGIDNSFGENIVPLMVGDDPDFEVDVNAQIAAGDLTFMTYVVGFDDSTANTTTALGLTGAFLAGGNYEEVQDAGPAWNLSTNWPVLSSSLDCPAGGCPPGTNPVAAATAQFSHAFQSEGWFVNEGTPLTLSFAIGGQRITLPIHAAVITFQPVAPGSVTNGTIAGVLSTQEFVQDLEPFYSPTPVLCSQTNAAQLEAQIEQASDIVLGADGETVSNQPGQPCNGISIGLGFAATEIAAPTPADVVNSVEPPCVCCDGGP